MANIDCSRFIDTQEEIQERRREVNILNQDGKRRLSQIAAEERAITREITRLISNLTFLEGRSAAVRRSR